MYPKGGIMIIASASAIEANPLISSVLLWNIIYFTFILGVPLIALWGLLKYVKVYDRLNKIEEKDINE